MSHAARPYSLDGGALTNNVLVDLLVDPEADFCWYG
jgi:hypothetical protein